MDSKKMRNGQIKTPNRVGVGAVVSMTRLLKVISALSILNLEGTGLNDSLTNKLCDGLAHFSKLSSSQMLSISATRRGAP